MEQSGVLKWRFDVSTFRLIGRDLITDRVTALFELVKNCYDANATNVSIHFENVGLDGKNSKIIIEDDGIGMSFEDIRDKWMVIGTSNKKKSPYSPAPMKRKCVGEKGIGRFAVDKLGDKVNIITKQNGEQSWIDVEIDWEENYNQSNSNGDIKLFTDIENKYKCIDAADTSLHGTKLVITNIREIWVENDIKRFISEISKLVSPLANISYPMDVHVDAPEFSICQNATRTLDDFSLATLSFSLGVDSAQLLQESAYFNERIGQVEIKSIPFKSFGGIKMKVYYFDDAARRRYRKDFPHNEIDGIKIYRDGIITTPFAESQDDDDKKRDVLGIDKRLWRDIFNRVSSREFIGFVEITREGNPQIIDATNRQDFVDNEQYRELKNFIITQLNAIEEYKKYSRNKKKKENQNTLETAGQNLTEFIASVEDFTRDNPELKVNFAPVIEQARKTDKAVKTAIKERKEAEQEFARKESIYMSIMSLQEYAIHITHAVRTTLNKIRDRVEYFNLFFPDSNEEELFAQYAKEMYKEFIILNRVIDYMLSYSQSNIQPEDVDLSLTINEIFAEYSPQLRNNGITVDVSLPKKMILKNTRKQFFRDIFQNILDNSLKALKDCAYKIIRCSVIAENDRLVILISDTGVGIPVEKREWVFGIYNTTTEEQGGAGIGLYVVKTRVESLNGTVAIVDSEFGHIGTTIKIELPFKQ